MSTTRQLTQKEKETLRREERRLKEERARKYQIRQRQIRQAMTIAIVFVIAGLVFTTAHQNSIQPNNIPVVVRERLSYQTLDLSNDAIWKPNANRLPALMAALNIPYSDPPQLHHHVHLDLYINGQKITVPEQIGLSNEAEVPVHTHDPSGIIHIETVDTNFKPTLGLLFDVWGVAFSENSIGGYASDGSNKLSSYVNGLPYAGDPRQLPFNQHDEIVIAFGNTSQLPSPMPSSYEFPNGY